MAEPKHSPRVVLVTGAAGFIGCNFVRFLLDRYEDIKVVSFDALTYAGSLANLAGVDEAHSGRHRFVHADIRDAEAVRRVFVGQSVDTVVHLAAESHVDRSITAPGDFLQTNVLGTYVLLEAAGEAWKNRHDVRFHHVSTDEVFGSIGAEGRFTEQTPYDPSSPYSASKAASDHLVRAWNRTYRLPATLSNCSNNFGPFQFPEKLLPLMICKALAQEPLPVYGDGKNVRDWLYVEDHCAALDRIVRYGQDGRTYNVGAGNEWANIDLVNLLCDMLQELRPREGGYRELISFVKDRPGHDRRYAIDSSRLKDELDWSSDATFESQLHRTVQWYLDHAEWIATIRREKYAGQRLGTL